MIYLLQFVAAFLFLYFAFQLDFVWATWAAAALLAYKHAEEAAQPTAAGGER